MLRLFIQDKEVELNSEVQVAITKQFEDIANPTTIINDWSKTVSIPFTQNNHRLFGHIYCPDRVIVSSDSSLTGIYFDPYKKLDFRLQWGDSVLMTGYAKMEDITQTDGKGTYNLTLFGQLGKVFGEMQKITFDTSSSDTDYIIDGSEYVNEYITKDLVYSSWTSNGQTTDELIVKGDEGYHVTDIIGFAPNNSFSDNFEYGTYQINSGESEEFTDTLERLTDTLEENDDYFSKVTGISASTAIPDGLLPREIGEYRSYLQLPFIYWNKLFKIFTTKTREITGYEVELDKGWFNTKNPYWYNLVYMLKPFDTNDGDIHNNIYNTLSTSFSSSRYVNLGEWRGAPYTTEYVERMNPLAIQYEQVSGVLEKNNYHNQFNFGNNQLLNLHVRANTYLLVITQDVHIKDDNGLLFTVTATGQTGATQTCEFLIRHSGSSITYGNAVTVDTGNSDVEFDYAIIIPTMDAYFNLTKKDFGDYVTLSTKARWITNSYPISGSAQGTVVLYYGNSHQGSTVVGYPSNIEVVIPNHNWFHSNAPFVLNDLWNNDYNLFGEIIKYCKMYRIGIFADDLNKKIIFKPFYEYFRNYTVKDWTNKLDKSDDFIVKPITFENKYVSFNYEDSDTKLGQEYKKNYGVNYGEYKITTDYNFNNDTEELFENVKTSITNTDNVLSWTNLYDNDKIIYSFPSELYVYNQDEDKNQIDLFGSYYFHKGLRNFSTESTLNLRSVCLSDDTALQQLTNKYFYTQRADEVLDISTYPNLDIVYDDNICLFNVPMQNYTYLNNYSGKNSLYTNFWKYYLDERYDVQNKIVTCYLDLTPTDYIGFDYNHFITINNQLYMINKIYDYDVSSLEPTKVDLITIQNLDGYVNDDYYKNLDTLSISWSGTSYFSGEIGNRIRLGTVDSISDVVFSNGSKTYTTSGVEFSILNNSEVWAETVSKYVDEPDINFFVTLKNTHHSLGFNAVRYSVYPYPFISIYDINNTTQLSTIPANGVFRLHWERTDTDATVNRPTVTYRSTSSLGNVTVGTVWESSWDMYQVGEDEYFRYNNWNACRTSNLALGGTVTFTVVDYMGWKKTVTYTVA